MPIATPVRCRKSSRHSLHKEGRPRCGGCRQEKKESAGLGKTQGHQRASPVRSFDAPPAALTRSPRLQLGPAAAAQATAAALQQYDLDELLARVRSALRRRQWDRAVEAPARRSLEFDKGRVLVDFDSHEVEVAGERCTLTRLELDLLAYFADHAGRVLSRDELLERVWQLRNYPNTRTVDNFIVRLRRHFEPDPQHPVHFLSVRGAGYRFVPEPEAA